MNLSRDPATRVDREWIEKKNMYCHICAEEEHIEKVEEKLHKIYKE